jgi:glutaredoxin 3
MKATIYSKDHCPYCVRAKSLLNRLGIEYDEFVIGDSGSKLLESNQTWATREDLLERAPNARTVPQIWLDGVHVGGYTELAAKMQEHADITA